MSLGILLYDFLSCLATLLCPDSTKICKDIFGCGDLGNKNWSLACYKSAESFLFVIHV